MPEHFPFKDHRCFAEWFIIHSIVENERKTSNKIPRLPEGGVNITFTINGIECSVKDTLNYWATLLHELVEDKAKALIKDKYYDLSAKIEESIKDVLLEKNVISYEEM